MESVGPACFFACSGGGGSSGVVDTWTPLAGSVSQGLSELPQVFTQSSLCPLEAGAYLHFRKKTE